MMLFPKQGLKKKPKKSDAKMKAWHKEVCQRENYICQGCETDYSYEYYFNKKGENTNVFGHHVKSQGSSPELRFDPDNGNCTCLKCHTKHHGGNLEYKPNKSLIQ